MEIDLAKKMKKLTHENSFYHCFTIRLLLSLLFVSNVFILRFCFILYKNEIYFVSIFLNSLHFVLYISEKMDFIFNLKV